ncbi:MAG: hypothetical protein Q9181_001218 [Wetmoreana brouardii]
MAQVLGISDLDEYFVCLFPSLTDKENQPSKKGVDEYTKVSPSFDDYGTMIQVTILQGDCGVDKTNTVCDVPDINDWESGEWKDAKVTRHRINEEVKTGRLSEWFGDDARGVVFFFQRSVYYGHYMAQQEPPLFVLLENG